MIDFTRASVEFLKQSGYLRWRSKCLLREGKVMMLFNNSAYRPTNQETGVRRFTNCRWGKRAVVARVRRWCMLLEHPLTVLAATNARFP